MVHAGVHAGLPVGIDIASYQEYPDWDQVVGSGIQFAFSKITEDTGYINPYFAENWAEMRRVQIHRGIYHFARPQGFDPIEEADYFLDTIDRLAGPLQTGEMLVLDIESGTGDLGPWALAWCDQVEWVAGFKPLIYTGKWFSDSHGFGDDLRLAEYPLWLAAYQATMPPPVAPWQAVSFWQYTSSGRVPGISGDVDMNVFNGDAERIPLLGAPPPVSDTYNVGEGIRAKMAEHGDSPTTNEIYGNQEWSEAVGRSGAMYRYVVSLNKVFRFEGS